MIWIDFTTKCHPPVSLSFLSCIQGNIMGDIPIPGGRFIGLCAGTLITPPVLVIDIVLMLCRSRAAREAACGDGRPEWGEKKPPVTEGGWWWAGGGGGPSPPRGERCPLLGCEWCGCGTTTLSPLCIGCGNKTLCIRKSVGLTLEQFGELVLRKEEVLLSLLPLNLLVGSSSLKILLIPKLNFGAGFVLLVLAWLEGGGRALDCSWYAALLRLSVCFWSVPPWCGDGDRLYRAE